MSNQTPWLALVALSEEQAPTAASVAAHLAERFPEAAPLVATSETERGVTFTYGQATGNFTLVDRPIPWPQIEGPCEVAWYWPEAADVMRSHRSHLFLTLLDNAKDPINRAMNLTRLTTALAAATPAVGLVWGPSSQVHKPADFAKLAAKMTKEDLPLHLWIDFRVVQENDGTFGLFTTGMQALGHREFEVPRFLGDPQELAGAVYNVTHYVLDNGPILKDGEAVGLPDEKQVNVRIEPSQIDPSQEVIRLDFE